MMPALFFALNPAIRPNRLWHLAEAAAEFSTSLPVIRRVALFHAAKHERGGEAAQ